MFKYQTLYFPHVVSGNPTVPSQSNGLQPEFAFAV